MCRRLFLFLILIVSALTVDAQYFAQGKVVNLDSSEPISFANIGILNSGVGTISNGDGSFEIRIPAIYSKDSIIFSALGYQRLYIPVSDFTGEKYITVYLKEAPTTLNTVTVTGKQWKEKDFRLGHRNYDGSCIYADTVTAGSAMALLIKTDAWTGKNRFNYPMYVKEVQLMIVNNTFGEFRVRTRLYDVDPVTHLPGKDLLNQSIVTRTKIETGRLKIDLSKYNLAIKGNFYIGFEWIMDKNDRRYLYDQYQGFLKNHPDKIKQDIAYIEGNKVTYTNYQGNLYVGPSFGMSVAKKYLQDQICYYRLNSFGKWRRSLFILSANVVLGNKPSTGPNLITAPETIAEEQPVELMPFYTVESLSPDLETGQVSLKLKNLDTGRFNHKIRNPVRIQLRRQDNEIAFYADNHSLYPYQVEMRFSELKNLGPMISGKSFIVPPGVTPLLTLHVYEPSIPHYHYSLSVLQNIGDTSQAANEIYPYLIPVGNLHKAYVSGTGHANNLFYDNTFRLNKGDTVYAMRKGLITATPDMRIESDRIAEGRSLEILHSDGTVMVYFNINYDRIFVRTGETVYPGQPLGIIDSGNTLEVELYQVVSEGKIIKLNIHYFTVDQPYCDYADIENGNLVYYPDSIIIKEMDDRELARYNRKSIY